jgi:hypothetical protein
MAQSRKEGPETAFNDMTCRERECLFFFFVSTNKKGLKQFNKPIFLKEGVEIDSYRNFSVEHPYRPENN